METLGDQLAEAKRKLVSADALLKQAKAGGPLPFGVTIHELERSIQDYIGIIDRLGFRENLGAGHGSQE